MKLAGVFFQAVGICVMGLLVAGAFGIGHFNLYYGGQKVVCTKAPS